MKRVHLLSPDLLAAGLLAQYLAAWYQVSVTEAGTAIAIFHGSLELTSSREDAAIVDARSAKPDLLTNADLGTVGIPLVLIAPKGVRAHDIPSHVSAAVGHHCPPTEIRVALEEAFAGRRYRSPAFAVEERIYFWRSRTPPTARQRAVFAFKQQGLTNNAIAAKLGIVVKAVEGIVTELRHGVGLSGREPFHWCDGRLPPE